MAAAWDDDAAVSLAKGTLFKRAKLYVPALGMPGGGGNLGIPANAKHRAAAMLFIAYLFEPEVQKQLNATIGSYLARTDVSGENALIPEDQRQKNGRPWLPWRLQGLFHPAVRCGSAAEIGLVSATLEPGRMGPASRSTAGLTTSALERRQRQPFTPTSSAKSPPGFFWPAKCAQAASAPPR